MLSDREREALRRVERQIRNEDPAFVRSFDARAQRLPHHAGRLGITIFVVAGLLLSTVVLVAGSLGGAMLFAFTTGLVWLVWWWVGGPHHQPS